MREKQIESLEDIQDTLNRAIEDMKEDLKEAKSTLDALAEKGNFVRKQNAMRPNSFMAKLGRLVRRICYGRDVFDL